MAENYDLIFGQSASQQYGWSDSDYQNGWQTVGSTPPTAEQFDALQRRSDTKAKDLNDRLSPLETKAEADGRQAATAYAEGVMVTADGLPNGWLLECIVAGVTGTGALEIPSPLVIGGTIVDGTVQWQIRKGVTLPYELPEYMETLLDDKDAETARATLGAPSMTGANASGSWNINAATATKLATPRTIALTGNVTGSADFDGSKNIQIATSLANVSALAHSLLSKTTAADMRGVIEANAQNCGGIVAESLTSPGYVKFANGFIIEWGSVSVNDPGAGGSNTAYKKYWGYPIKMSAPIGALAIDLTGNYPDPQPLCIWALNNDTLIVNCPKVRTAFILAIGIA